MQSVLSIDATNEPAIVAVTRLDGTTIEVLETHRISLAKGLTPTSAGDAARGDGANTPEQPKLDFTTMVRSPWTSAVVIIAGDQYHSLNLDLPFNDSRRLNKIIDLEVQDLVPFDVDEFVLQHRTVSTNQNGTFDVHVSIMPRARLATILAACREGGIEPAVLSTATSVVGVLPKLYPSFPRDAVVVMYRAPVYYVTFMLDGEVRSDRIIDRSILNGDTTSPTAALTEIRLSIAAMEGKYGRTFEKVFLLDTPFNATEASAQLAHPAALLALPNIGGEPCPGAEVAVLSSVFGLDREVYPALTNFRTREFAYNLQLNELWRGLAILRPYFLATLVAVLVSLGVVYMLREQRIDRLDRAIRAMIQSVAPELNAPAGREYDALLGQIKSLDQQLKDLGSPSQASPLDTLLDISNSIPKTIGITLGRLSVKGTRISFELSAPNYAAAENLKSAIEKQSRQFCRVKMDTLSTAATGQNTRGFRFEVYLCD